MRDVIGGDAIFDWTIWYAAAVPLCLERRLAGQHRLILEDLGRGAEYDESDALCDAEKYALALSRLGWCLRDAGALCEAHQRGWKSFVAGVERFYPGKHIRR